MARRNDAGWFLRYVVGTATTRLLLSLPVGMMGDARRVAHAQHISVAEMTRRAMTKHMAEVARAHPEVELEGRAP